MYVCAVLQDEKLFKVCLLKVFMYIHIFNQTSITLPLEVRRLVADDINVDDMLEADDTVEVDSTLEDDDTLKTDDIELIAYETR